MQSRIEGVTIVGDLQWRAWPGFIADVWEVECASMAHGEYVSQAPRLFMILDVDETTTIDLMSSPAGETRVALGSSSPLCYVPAGMPIWSRLQGGGRLRHLDLHLDVHALETRFPENMDWTALETPRLSISDKRLMALGQLIALECTEESTLHDLYAESLVTALLAIIGNVERFPAESRGRLAPRQWRRVSDFLEENCARNVTLQELADLVGLSPSYFSQAFKATTGVPPHRWQLQKRIERAKSMLETTNMSLTEAAVAAGFSDQAHLTRMFRRFAGTTPAAWLRTRMT